MSTVTSEIAIILILILMNGVFSMAELAVLSARKSRLQNLADGGDVNAASALELIANPNRFLSTIQIGITIVGIITGAVGGATLSHPLAGLLSRLPILQPYAEGVSFGIVVVLITYLSLVIGELVPKQIALRNAERLALLFARPMQSLSHIAGILVRILTLSTEFVLRVLHQGAPLESSVTEQEVRQMITQATEEGVFEPAEEKIVTQVFRLADRKINTFLTPRTDITWLDINDPWEVNRAIILASEHTCFPVAEETLDNVIGLALAKDLLDQCLQDDPLDLRKLLTPPLFLPDNQPAIEVIERLRDAKAHLALVIDEYGGIQGLVTIYDLIEMMIGKLPGAELPGEVEITLRADGTYLVDGKIFIDQFIDAMHLSPVPEDHAGDYQTLGGYVMTTLGRIRATGDTLTWDGLNIEVVDMDGLRVDKLLVTPAAANPDSTDLPASI